MIRGIVGAARRSLVGKGGVEAPNFNVTPSLLLAFSLDAKSPSPPSDPETCVSLQLGLDAQKMQEMEKAKVNVEHIFLNHGVPLSVAGFGASNFATAQNDRINFRSDTVLPLINFFIDGINSPRGLIPAFHADLKLDFSLDGLIDVEQVGKAYQWLVDSGGMSPNDAREMAGLPRIDNPMLDQYFIKSDRMPIEMAGLADVPPLAPPAKPKPALPPGAGA